MRVAIAARQILQETGNEAVMWGDEGLCHLIAERLGWKHDGPRTSDRVLAALAKTPAPLVKKKTKAGNGRLVNIFRLQEKDIPC